MTRSSRPAAGRALACFAALLAATGAARAAPPTLLEQDRGIYARATTVQAGQADEDVDPAEAADFTPFTASTAPTAATDDATAGATATLDSDLDGSTLSALGTASSSSTTSDAEARADAPADAFFEVVFQATATEPFTLAGTIDASATGGDGFASVELFDVDGASSLASHEALAGQSDTFSDGGTLQAGTTYRLTAYALSHARTAAPGAHSGDASFDAVLYLPEPGRKVSLAAGIAALWVLGRSRRRARS